MMELHYSIQVADNIQSHLRRGDLAGGGDFLAGPVESVAIDRARVWSKDEFDRSRSAPGDALGAGRSRFQAAENGTFAELTKTPTQLSRSFGDQAVVGQAGNRIDF